MPNNKRAYRCLMEDDTMAQYEVTPADAPPFTLLHPHIQPPPEDSNPPVQALHRPTIRQTLHHSV